MIAIACVAASLLLRAFDAATRPLWFDELFTRWITLQPLGGMFRALRHDPGPPLFYLLEKASTRLVPSSATATGLRLVPFLATAALFLAARRRRFSGGPLFPILLATSPLFFVYSAEARAYSLLGALALVLFLSAIRGRSRAALVVAAATAALLPYTHYLGLLVVAASIAVCAACRRFRFAAAQLAGSAVFLPWLPFALGQPPASVLWNAEGPGAAAASLFGQIGFWPRLPPYFSSAKLPAEGLGIGLGIALVAATAAAARNQRDVRRALAFAGSAAILVIAAGRLHPVYFPGRTEMAFVPVVLWGVARAARKSRFVLALASLAAAAGAAAIAFVLFHAPPRPPYAADADFVAEASRPADLVVAADANYLPLRLAKDLGALPAKLTGVPASIERHPGWFRPGARIGIPAERARLSAALAAVRPPGRIFLAIPPDPPLRALVAPLLEGRPARQVRPPGGSAVLVVYP